VLIDTLDINLIVTAGAVLLAVLASLFAFRAALGGDGAAKGWKDKMLQNFAAKVSRSQLQSSCPKGM